MEIWTWAKLPNTQLTTTEDISRPVSILSVCDLAWSRCLAHAPYIVLWEMCCSTDRCTINPTSICIWWRAVCTNVIIEVIIIRLIIALFWNCNWAFQLLNDNNSSSIYQPNMMNPQFLMTLMLFILPQLNSQRTWWYSSQLVSYHSVPEESWDLMQLSPTSELYVTPFMRKMVLSISQKMWW